MVYFVTAIGTDSGKTLVAAVICEALEADYWKPVQAGTPRDTDTVRHLITNTTTSFHPESFLLRTPASPHAAAKIDKTEIRLSDLALPHTRRPLVIEGAGGCLVPLNDQDLMIDLIPLFQAEAILVSNHYLGSINHTLLTAEALRARNIAVKGLIFNGAPQEETERIILRHTGLRCLLRINMEPVINRFVVKEYAQQLKSSWHG